MARLTAEQLRDLEIFCRSHPDLVLLLEEFKSQRTALDTVRQFVDSFGDAEGTASDVVGLVADLKEVLDGVEAIAPPYSPDSESRHERHN